MPLKATDTVTPDPCLLDARKNRCPKPIMSRQKSTYTSPHVSVCEQYMNIWYTGMSCCFEGFGSVKYYRFSLLGMQTATENSRMTVFARPVVALSSVFIYFMFSMCDFQKIKLCTCLGKSVTQTASRMKLHTITCPPRTRSDSYETACSIILPTSCAEQVSASRPLDRFVRNANRTRRCRSVLGPKVIRQERLVLFLQLARRCPRVEVLCENSPDYLLEGTFCFRFLLYIINCRTDTENKNPHRLSKPLA